MPGVGCPGPPERPAVPGLAWLGRDSLDGPGRAGPPRSPIMLSPGECGAFPLADAFTCRREPGAEQAFAARWPGPSAPRVPHSALHRHDYPSHCLREGNE